MSSEPASAPSPQPNRSTARVIIVGLLSAWVAFMIFAGIRESWFPPGDFGLTTDGSLVVAAVDPGSPAAKAGIQPGDRIDEQASPFYSRYISGPFEPAPGAPETIRVIHATKSRLVTLVAVPRGATPQERVFIVLYSIIGLVLVALGAILVLLKPTRVTWPFFVWCVGVGTGADMAPYWIPAAVGYWNSWLYTMLIVAGWVSFLVFAVRFPYGHAVGRWQLVDRAAPAIFVVLAVLTVLNHLSILGYFPGKAIVYAYLYHVFAIYTIAMAALLATYLRSRSDERQRVKWVMVGLSIGMGSNVIAYGINMWWPTQSGITLWIWLGQGAIPLSIVYAVIRYRVLDVNFVINRTLVYATLTSLVVAIFALVDWFFVKKLVSTSAGLAAEVFVALAIGFWLNALHDRVNWVIDSTFFRRRYRAEQRLRRAAVALPHAASFEVLNSLIVEEPLEALDLNSAAIFERTAEGTFARAMAVGWPDESAREFTQHDRLLMHLESDPVPLRTRDIHWMRPDLPHGSARPALALPILVRRQLAAIAFYGEPKSGADLDPDEVRAIGALAVAAGAAYDHLEADALRKQVANLQLELTRA